MTDKPSLRVVVVQPMTSQFLGPEGFETLVKEKGIDGKGLWGLLDKGEIIIFVDSIIHPLPFASC